jgi:peptide/nickel transport system substrate-binding protein
MIVKSWKPFLRGLQVASLTAAVSLVALPAMKTADAQNILRLGGSTEIGNRGNVFKGAGTPSIFVWHAVFDAQTFVDASGTVQPRAALSWENKDKNTWIFKLRPNVKFSNGAMLSAADVKASIEWLQSEAGKGFYVARESGSRVIASVNIIDDLTFEIKTSTPEVLLPSRLSMLNLVPAKAFADMGIDEFTQKPIGTGAFTVTDWEPVIIMKARSDSWRVAKIGGIEYNTLNERASRVQALLSGQIDIAINLSFDNVNTVKNGGFRVDTVARGSVMSLAMPNMVDANSPLNDVRVRQALNYAINGQAIVDNLTGGLVRAASQPATPAATGFAPQVKPYPYDPDKARSLLAAAGHANGFDLKYAVVTGAFPGDSEIYQQVAQDLSKVGVTLELEKIQFPQWLKTYFANSWWESGYHGFSLSMNTIPYLDATRPMGYYSCGKNNPFFCDEDLAAQLEASRSIFDTEKRMKALHELAQAYHDAAPALYLIEMVDLVGLGPNVQNFQNVNNAYNYTTMTLSN